MYLIYTKNIKPLSKTPNLSNTSIKVRAEDEGASGSIIGSTIIVKRKINSNLLIE